MSEVKRYTFFAYIDDDVAELDYHNEPDGDYVLASDYDIDTKALEDKARSQHARDSAELRDLCSQRDGFKAELWRVKEERDKLAAELAELKATLSRYETTAENCDRYREQLEGWQLVPVEPTAEMVAAAFVGKVEAQCVQHQERSRVAMAANYKAMLAAAPSKEDL